MDAAFGFILIPVGLFLGHASNMVAHRPRKELRFNLARCECRSDFRRAAIRAAVVWRPTHYQTKSTTQPFQLLTWYHDSLL